MMLQRPFAILTAAGTMLAAGCLASAAWAADPTAAQEKLRKYLELQDRVESATPVTPGPNANDAAQGQPRSRGLPAPPPPDQDKYHWIGPEGTQPPNNGRSGALENDFGLGPHLALSDFAPTFEADPWAVRSRGAPTQATPPGNRRSLTTGQPAAPAVAKSTPVARKNSYVVQFRPSASAADIASLLERYKLRKTQDLGLGAVLVEVDNAAEPEISSRSVGPAPATSGSEALEQILLPQIIQDLRRERAVNAAFVNTTLTTKTLPPPSKASAVANGKRFTWSWARGVVNDGNWGLKAIRLPAVWSILSRLRAKEPSGALRPKVGVVDTGFVNHKHLTFTPPLAASAQTSALISSVAPNCELGHGTHVAGIVGAIFGRGEGTDGIVPDSTIEAVPIRADFFKEASTLNVNKVFDQRTMLIADVINATNRYLVDNIKARSNLRVVNISLAYNWVTAGLSVNEDLEKIEGLKLHIAEQAKFVQNTADLVADQVLFVVAAGNDSDQRRVPLDAKWASPFAWAGTQSWAEGPPSPNIIVVEAADRDGNHARFSNTSGHVSAPGVDIMSTLAPGTTSYGVCSGTSQAAPYVSGLAAILFEMDPSLTPTNVADILKGTATPAPDGIAAPRIDALEAVLGAAPDRVVELADLNGDGKVDALDLALFKAHYQAVTKSRATGQPLGVDLNGSGVVEGNGCAWPIIDLLGRGVPPSGLAETLRLGGSAHSDLGLIEHAWTDDAKSFKTAMAELGMDVMLASELTQAGQPIPTSATCK